MNDDFPQIRVRHQPTDSGSQIITSKTNAKIAIIRHIFSNYGKAKLKEKNTESIQSEGNT